MNTKHPNARIASISNGSVAQINQLQTQIKTEEGKEVILIAYEC